MISSVPFFRE